MEGQRGDGAISSGQLGMVELSAVEKLMASLMGGRTMEEKGTEKWKKGSRLGKLRKPGYRNSAPSHTVQITTARVFRTSTRSRAGRSVACSRTDKSGLCQGWFAQYEDAARLLPCRNSRGFFLPDSS
jgi:hypothetical protein